MHLHTCTDASVHTYTSACTRTIDELTINCYADEWSLSVSITGSIHERIIFLCIWLHNVMKQGRDDASVKFIKSKHSVSKTVVFGEEFQILFMRKE